MPDELAQRIRERLRVLGLNARAASIAAGGSPDMIRNILNGKSRNPHMTTLRKIASILQTSETWLLTGEDGVPNSEASARGDVAPALGGNEVEYRGRIDGAHTPLRQDLPIRGTAMGSIVQNDVEGFVLGDDVIGYIERPRTLDKIREAYAILVTGDSMWPLHPPGATRLVNPLRPTAPGNSVIVITKRWDNDPGQAYIKILKRRTQAGITLTQLNPLADIEIPREYVVAIHYVLDYEDLLKR